VTGQDRTSCNFWLIF